MKQTHSHKAPMTMTQQKDCIQILTKAVLVTGGTDLFENDGLNEVSYGGQAERNRKGSVVLPLRVEPVVGIARVGWDISVLVWDCGRAGWTRR